MSKEIADRAWLALHALPRDKRGFPPSYRSVEKSARMAVSTLSRLFAGNRKRLDVGALGRLAVALKVDPEWLVYGTGTPPRPTGPVPPRGSVSEEGILEPRRLDATSFDVSPGRVAERLVHIAASLRSAMAAGDQAAVQNAAVDVDRLRVALDDAALADFGENEDHPGRLGKRLQEAEAELERDDTKARRDFASMLCRAHGVSRAAVRSVMREKIDFMDEGLSILDWVDRMRTAEHVLSGGDNDEDDVDDDE